MAHEWRLADWAEVDGIRRFVFGVTVTPHCVVCDTVTREGDSEPFHTNELVHIPDCTSWEWEAPKLIDPGEGYRLVNKQAEAWTSGDEYLGSNGMWYASNNGEADGFSGSMTYRRKIEPQYKPWDFGSMPVAVKVRRKLAGLMYRTALPSTAGSCVLAGDCELGYEKLFIEYEQLDGTPCGVKI